MQTAVRLFIVAAILEVAAGCGFQLRGEQTLPEAMAVTYIAAPDQESVLVETLVRALRRANVQTTRDAAEATAVLRLLEDSAGQRVLSVGADGVPIEYELFRTIEYELVAGDKTVVRSRPITVTRDYLYVESDVLGTQRQATRLDAGLASELTALVIRTLSAAR